MWQKTAQPLRSSFLLQGAIDRLFLSTTWEMYPLRFQVQISRIQRQNKFSSSRFSDVGDWSKITCKWTNQIFSFFSYFVGTWKQDKRFISSKKFNEITIKVRANIYLFIYLLLFIYYLFIILFRHGLSVFFIIQIRPPFTSTQGASPPHSFLPFSRILKYGPRDPLSYRVQF